MHDNISIYINCLIFCCKVNVGNSLNPPVGFEICAPPKKSAKNRPFADLKFDTQTEGLGKLNRTEQKRTTHPNDWFTSARCFWQDKPSFWWLKKNWQTCIFVMFLRLLLRCLYTIYNFKLGLLVNLGIGFFCYVAESIQLNKKEERQGDTKRWALTSYK